MTAAPAAPRPVDLAIEAPPAHVHVPPRDGSLLRSVEATCARVGRTLDPAQRLAVDVLTSSWADGRPAALEGALVGPRQNLKTYVLEGIALTLANAPGEPPLIVWSAQEVETAKETFETFLGLADSFPWLAGRIARVSRSTGREQLTFTSGARLKFRARRKAGGRGLAGDLVILDEALFLAPEHISALLPLLSTRRRGRVLYASSPPLEESHVLRRIIGRGRAGGPGAPAYAEWCAAGSWEEPGCATDGCQHEVGVVGCALDDENNWRAANPAHVYGRISAEYLRGERQALTPEAFANERLGWWRMPGIGDLPISQDDWTATCRPVGDAPESTHPVFALDAAPGLWSAAIAVAVRGDVPHVELASARRDTEWVGPRLSELMSRWPGSRVVVLPDSPAVALLPALAADHGVTVEVLAAGAAARACQHLERIVRERAMTHAADPVLDTALLGAARRVVGDGLWTWTRRKSAGSIAPLVAATAALWALEMDQTGSPSGIW